MNKFDVSVLKQYAGNYDENQMWNKIKGFFFAINYIFIWC